MLSWRLTFSLLASAALALIALSGAGGPEPEVADAQGAGGRDARQGEAVVPDQYIVTYNRSAESPAAETEARERRQGFEADYVYRRAIEGFSAELSQRQVDRLEADPEVASVTPDRKVRAVASLASGEPTPPPGARRIGAATTSDVRQASTANVAVIDTGVDLDHPDLVAESGRNCVAPGTPADDDNGHGTHVAGTIAAENNGEGVVGVAPGTKVFAAKVLGADGSGTTSQVICGIDWVTGTRTDSNSDNDIEVANMSLGATAAQPVGTCATTSDPEHKAICTSIAAGVTYVVAAGNRGWDFDYQPNPNWPAAYPEVLTVSAMADSDGRSGGSGGAPACRTGEADDRYASFSNYAATAAGSAHAIAAPGVCIRSTWLGGTYATASGTSMASPHVAGAVALCIDEGGRDGPCANLSNPQIIGKLRSDAAFRAAAVPGSGFAGDPGAPIPGRYFGHLAWAGSDTEPPRIAATSPANGQAGIRPGTGVAVAFSEPMYRAATQGAFSLVRASDGGRVAGTFSWSGNAMIFRPAVPLRAGTHYVARVSTAARDVSANPLGAERAWWFKTLATVTALPRATVVESGSQSAGTVGRLAADDNRYFQVDSTKAGTRVSSWYGRFGGVSNALRSLRVTLKGKSSAACRQTLSVWRWTTRSWVTLDSRSLGRTEVPIDRSVPGRLADYVSGGSGTGEVRVRARCARGSSSFVTSGDLLRVVYTRP